MERYARVTDLDHGPTLIAGSDPETGIVPREMPWQVKQYGTGDDSILM